MHLSQNAGFVISHKARNLRLLAQIFAHFKIPRTLNSDILSLASVYIADNSRHSFRGPTFMNISVCLRAMSVKRSKTFLRG